MLSHSPLYLSMLALFFIGFGVFTTREFRKGEFLVNYSGELIDVLVAQEREQIYTNDMKGSYMYYFKHTGKDLWYVKE